MLCFCNLQHFLEEFLGSVWYRAVHPSWHSILSSSRAQNLCTHADQSAVIDYSVSDEVTEDRCTYS